MENYTVSNSRDLDEYSYEFNEEFIDYLKDPNSFRNFDEGLIEILRKKEYKVDLTNRIEMANFLFEKLNNIHSSINKKTVISWFSGKHRPKIEFGYRKQIYEICFALQLNLDETKWFFQHVYYDRAFNCHTIKEAVYYFAFLNSYSYAEANSIIDKINEMPCDNNSKTTIDTTNYTRFIQNRISNLHSDKELIDFLVQQKENFNSWNHSALETLKKYIDKLIPTEKGKREIDNLKRTIERKNTVLNVIPDLKEQQQWGLIMQEFFFDLNDINDLEYIKGKNITSNSFILERILETNKGIQNITGKVPYIVRNNFPSKKIMSDVMSENKGLQSTAYDAIRKLIILLDFYVFWCSVKLNPINIPNDLDIIDDREYLYEIYCDEINNILFKCGYEELYPGNPYDWLFMCSARNDEPLNFLRSYILEILPD